jgi:nucleoside-diphosphate-sugar epimerase
MNNILITGASGFVGSNLVRKLIKSKDNVSILVRKQSNLWRLKDVLSQIDIHFMNEDAESLKTTILKIKPDIVYHLATYGTYPFQQNFNTIIQSNILLSINLMRILESSGGVKRLINLGSSSEYGIKSKPMKETDMLEPITPYGITKVAQTLFAQYFSRQSSLPSVTLRLFSVYGPYEEPGRLIYDIMVALIQKNRLKLGSPLPRRDFIHVDDVIIALQKAAKTRGVEGEIFNIGGGKDYSVKDAVDIARDISGTNLKVTWNVKDRKESLTVTRDGWQIFKKQNNCSDGNLFIHLEMDCQKLIAGIVITILPEKDSSMPMKKIIHESII